jgi:hypothetical protein
MTFLVVHHEKVISHKELKEQKYFVKIVFIRGHTDKEEIHDKKYRVQNRDREEIGLLLKLKYQKISLRK